MNTTATHLLAEPAPAIATPLHIVIAYDDAVMAEAARNVILRFTSRWAPDVETHRDEWSFAELTNPKCHDEALDLAAACSLLVIATRAGPELPTSFAQWMDDWLRTRNPVDTAIIYCGLSPMPPADLRARAAAHRIEFFATVLKVPDSVIPASKRDDVFARLASINTDLLPEVSGIND